MTPEAFQHFVFVDYENVPSVNLGLAAGLSVHVTVLLGKNQKNVPVAFAKDMGRLGHAQVSLVEVDASGHNALDIILAFYLGKSVARTPGARFYIVSKDKDFEALLGHLHGKNVPATRHDSFATLPFLTPPKKPAVVAKAAAAKPPEDRRAKLIARIKNPHSPNRPSSRKALVAHIKTGLGKESSDPKVEDILRELVERKIVAIDEKDKVSYAK